jgi:hypothetical protein
MDIDLQLYNVFDQLDNRKNILNTVLNVSIKTLNFFQFSHLSLTHSISELESF